MDYQRNILDTRKIYGEITVQPNESMRFRYVSEKTAGRIFGKNHSSENPVYPTIKIYNYIGNVFVRISCVTKDNNRPHPHNLVKIKKDSKTDNCYAGIYTVEVPNSPNGINFPNLGLHCVKKDDFKKVLEIRSQYGIDPFHTGYDHQITSADLHCVRLCFEVFIGGTDKPCFTLVSNPITDAKDLVIYKISHVSGSVEGNEEILMFCEKIVKSDDIKIRFFEERNNETVWESYAKFEPKDVHKQYGIAFLTPKYKDPHIFEEVIVKIQLVRFDGAVTTVSGPRKFIYKPNESEIKLRRLRYGQSTSQQMRNDLSRPKLKPNYNTNELYFNIQPSYNSFGPSNSNIPGPSNLNLLGPGPSNVNVPTSVNLNIPNLSNVSDIHYASRYTMPVLSTTIPVNAEDQINDFEKILKQKEMEAMLNQQIRIDSDEANALDSDQLMDICNTFQ